MRHLKPTKVILSAYKSGRSLLSNESAASELVCDLAAAKHVEHFREAKGRFTGLEEEAVICWIRPGSILEGIDELSDLANGYGQETILVVHGDDAAELVETGANSSAILGTFQRVEAPEPGEDFTKVDSSFYVVR